MLCRKYHGPSNSNILFSSQDPVKYPDDMSTNFKSFLKGLLNKVFLFFDNYLPHVTCIFLMVDEGFENRGSRYHKID